MINEVIGGVLILLGVIDIVLAVLGTFRFHYVLNRMHASAMADTLGVLLVLSGLIVLSGFSALSLKLLVIIVFMWMASPVMSHLIARAEALTYTDLTIESEVIPDDDSL